MGVLSEHIGHCKDTDYFFDKDSGSCVSCQSACLDLKHLSNNPHCNKVCLEVYRVLRLEQSDMEGDAAVTVAMAIIITLAVVGALLLVLVYVWWNHGNDKQKLAKAQSTSWIKACFPSACRGPRAETDRRTPIYTGPGSRVDRHALDESTDVAIRSPMLPSRKHPQIKKLETAHCTATSQFLTAVNWTDGLTSTSLSTPVYYPCIQPVNDVLSPSEPTPDKFEDVSLY